MEARTTYQFLVDRDVVQYNPMGIIVLYNRVYECVSTMYNTYSNHFDTSHVAYPEQITTEDQAAGWAIFTAQQPPLADPSDNTSTRHSSSTAALHTYPLHHIPSYIFPTSTPPSASAPNYIFIPSFAPSLTILSSSSRQVQTYTGPGQHPRSAPTNVESVDQQRGCCATTRKFISNYNRWATGGRRDR